MARSRRRSRWASEAALEALVRFGPEQSGLKALERQARDTYRSTVRSARGAAQGQIQEIGLARPQVKKNYDDAGLRQARIAHDVIAPVIEGLGPAAQSLKAATAIEQGSAQQRLGESRAAALTDLSAQRVQARQGEAFAVSNAGSSLKGELQKIFERQQDLRRESGAFTALTTRQLRTAAQERADTIKAKEDTLSQQERNSLRSSGIDPDTGKPIKGGKLDPKKNTGGGGGGGSGGASPAATAAAQDAIQEARNWAKRLKGADLTRSEIAQALLSGREAVQKHDPDTGKPLYNDDGSPVMRSAIPKAKSTLLLSVALDQEFDGHVSRQNQRRLHRRLSIRDLPVTSFGDWRREAESYNKRTGRPARG